ncbi:MAG: site-specific integrase [Bacteroidaceae bacterium]|nr:site-specific integrase [Bacteroidaceae bacterium]
MANKINKSKENPKLGQKVLADGRASLFLEYYIGYDKTPVLDEYGEQVFYTSGSMKGQPKYKITHHRRKETLSLYIISKPRTPIERQQNKEILTLAEKIRFERQQQFLEDREGYRLKRDTQINFLDYFQTYIEKYCKKDVRMIKLSFNRFCDFLEDTQEYHHLKDYIKPEQLTKDMMIDFTEYLQSRSKGEGAKTIYQRFKKVINYALDHDILTYNPCKGVSIRVDDNILKKSILSENEIELLMNARHPRENTNITRAFLFCLYTGLRFVDVKDLTFSNIDYSNRFLSFEQNKVKGHSANSGVVIPLNDDLLNLLGTPTAGQDKNSLIFKLPTYWMCLKALQRWVDRAGINKHITWHCARHSFAVNILNKGANIKTVASLLGHSDLKHTEKYTRAVDELKRDAINSLPKIINF